MHRKWLGLIVGNLFSTLVVAGSMGDIYQNVEDESIAGCSKIITISGGAVWYDSRNSEILTLVPGVAFNYISQPPNKVLGSGELFFALGQPLEYNTSGQLGLAFGYSGNAEINGTSFPIFAGIPIGPATNYEYRIKNYRIGLKGKLFSEYSPWIKPYLSAGIAAAFNVAYNYVPFPVSNVALAPSFTDNTNVAFTYTAGAGLELVLNPQWRLGIGYEFSDWGKSELGPVVTQINTFTPINRGIKMDHFYTNELLASISYLM